MTKLLEGLQQIRFDYKILDPDIRDWFERDALVLRAHFSTSIEGNALGEDDVEELIQSSSRGGFSKDETEVLNYVEALNWVDDYCQTTPIRVDERVVRHLHSLILEGENGILTPGAYRNGQNYVRDPRTKEVVYTPPPAGDVMPLMRDLVTWVNDALQAGVNAVIVGGVAHLELVSIHPFWDGNGRTARALSTLVMESLGYGIEKLMVLDRYFGQSLRNYLDRIGETVGSTYSTKRDYTSWLEYFIEGVSDEAHLIHDRLVTTVQRRSQIREAYGNNGLKSRQADGLTYAVVHGKMRPRDYQRIASVSPQIASNDLKYLVKEKLLTTRGATRRRIYLPHPAFEASLRDEHA